MESKKFNELKNTINLKPQRGNKYVGMMTVIKFSCLNSVKKYGK